MGRFLGSMLLIALTLPTIAVTEAMAAQAQSRTAIHTITLPAGTHIPIRLAQSLDTRRDKPGTTFVANVSAPVFRNGRVIVPRGAVCRGHLVESRPSGRLKGHAVLTMSLDTIDIYGRRYAIMSSFPALVSQGSKRPNG